MCCPIDYTHVFSVLPDYVICATTSLWVCVFLRCTGMSPHVLPSLCAFVKQVCDFSYCFFSPFSKIWLCTCQRANNSLCVGLTTLRLQSSGSTPRWTEWLTDWLTAWWKEECFDAILWMPCSLSVSLPPVSLITPFSFVFSCEMCIAALSHAPQPPFATLTQAQVGKQLIQDQRRSLQTGAREQILSSIG